MNALFSKAARKLGLLVILVGLVLPGCESDPFKAGLGPKVDFTFPVIHWVMPDSGFFIKGGEATFRARITDDVKVEGAIIQYWQENEKEFTEHEMTQDPDNQDIWSFHLIISDDEAHRNYWVGGEPIHSNSDFYIKIVAWDAVPNTTSTEANSYIIKSEPPAVTMSSPFLETDFWLDQNGFPAETTELNGERFYIWDDVERRPNVFYKGDIIGNVTDIQGVKAPYPRIKIWDPNKGEKEDDVAWTDFRPDSFVGPWNWENRGENNAIFGTKNIGFKVRLYNRLPDGKSDMHSPMEATMQLPYKFRIMASDIGDPAMINRMTGEEIPGGANQAVIYYPPLEYPAAEFFINLSEGPPAIEMYINSNFTAITPEAFLDVDPYFNIHRPPNAASPYGQENNLRPQFTGMDNPFIIEVRARHSSSIHRAFLRVRGQKSPEWKYLKWARDKDSVYNTEEFPQANDPRMMDGKQEFLFLSPPIKKGTKVPQFRYNEATGAVTDSTEEFEFDGDEYEFTVLVWEEAFVDGDVARQTLLVRIVEEGPEVSFFNIWIPGPANNNTPASLDRTDMFVRGSFFDKYADVITDSFEFRFSDFAPGEWLRGTLNNSFDVKNVTWVIPLIGENIAPHFHTYALDDGQHAISIRISNDLGITTEIEPVEFVLDRSNPELALNYSPPFINGYNHDTTPDPTAYPLVDNYSTYYRSPREDSSDPLPGLESPQKYPTPPSDRGFWLTGIASNAGGGLEKVEAKIYAGNDLVVQTPYTYTETDLFATWHWGIFIPFEVLTGDKTYTVEVSAFSLGGRASVRTRDFTLDTVPPVSTIVTPRDYEHLTGTVSIRGAAGDDNAIRKVEYKIGKDSSAPYYEDAMLAVGQNPAAGFSRTSGLYSWNYDLVVYRGTYTNSVYGTEVSVDIAPTGRPTYTPANDTHIFLLPFSIRVTDIAGNTAVNYISPGTAHEEPYFLVLDPDRDIPVAEFNYPHPGAIVGGEVRVTGTAEDNDWIYAVLVRTYKGTQIPANIVHYPVPGTNDERETNDDGWALAHIPPSGDRLSVNWSFIINQFGELNNEDGSQQPVVLEILPIDSKQMHDCGDISEINLAYFAQHPEEYRQGFPETLSFRVDSTIPVITDIMVERTIDTVDYYTGVRAAGEFKLHAMVMGAGAIKRVQWRSAVYAPSYSNILYNGEPVLYSSTGTSAQVKMPVDEYGASALKTVNGSGLEVGRKYMIADTGSVNWNSIGVPADTPAAKFLVFVYNGAPITGYGEAYAALGPVSGSLTIESAWEQRFHYPVEITIDSRVRFPVDGKFPPPGGTGNAGGNLILDIKADDFTEPVAYTITQNLRIQIDNFYPSSIYRAARNASTATYWVDGLAVDVGPNSGPVEGIREVLAYFSRNGVYYNPKGGRWGQGTVAAGTSANNIKDGATGVIGPFANYPAMPPDPNNLNNILLNNYGAVRISNQELGEDSNGNGYIERFSESGGRTRWGFQWDTNAFTDGPITLHYIVIDMAGNATHYTKELFVRNNPPIISRIILKTDLTYSHTAGDIPSESRSYSVHSEYRNTGFSARNYKLRFDIETMESSGNGALTFRVSPVKLSGGAPVASIDMQPGKAYMIINPGNTSWDLSGAAGEHWYGGEVFVCTDPAVPEYDANNVLVTTGTAQVFEPILSDPDDRRAAGVPVSLAGGGSTIGASINFGSDPFIGIGDADFGQGANHIPDSAEPNGSLFLVKVWDTTVAGGNEDEQLADVILMGLNINNIDHEPPAAVINPFHWHGMNDNSLYLNSRNNGHIELEGDLDTAIYDQSVGIRDLDPKVSGQISIRGTVTDNNVVGSLWVWMDNFNFPNAAGDESIGTGSETRTYRQIATYTPGGGLVGIDQWTANGWRSTITHISLDQDGHKLNWQLDIDTGRRSAAYLAAADQAFRIISRDITGNTQAQSSVQTTAGDKTAYYRMDIVPYISGVETNFRTEGGLKRENIRSADGKYSVIRGTNNNFITVRGFNLNPAGSGSIRILSEAENNTFRGNPNTIPAGTPFTPAGVASPYTSFTMTNNSANSGYLTVIVNGVGTLNNINNNDAFGTYPLVLSTSGTGYELKPDISNGSDEENMPNRRADRYYTKNITLTDDVYLQFYTVIKTDVVDGLNPVMMMDDDNPVFGYVDLRGTTDRSADATIGPNTIAGNFHASYAMPQRTKFNGATGVRLDTEYLIKASMWDGMGMARDESGRYLHATTYNRDGAHLHLIYDRYSEVHRTNSNGNDPWLGILPGLYYGTAWGQGQDYGGLIINCERANNPNNNAIPLESNDYNGLLLNRYQYPRLIARGNSVSSFANYYMTYYDKLTGELLFRNFRIGTSGSSNGGTNQLFRSGPSNWPLLFNRGDIEKEKDAQGREYGAYTNLPTTGGVSGNNTDSRRKQAAASASTYFDMTVDSAGRAIIAYYDDSTGRLNIRYSNPLNGSNPTGDPGFVSSQANGAMPLYVGMFVSITIDSEDHLHIAAYDAMDSTLRYIYVENYLAATPAAAGVVAVTVDQYGSVGNWTDIKLHPATGEPYIAYYNATETAGRESIKIAWSKAPVNSMAAVLPGVDSNGYTTGRWEYRTVPAHDPPQGGSQQFQKVNLDFRTNGDPILGYLGANIEFSYPVSE